MEQVIEAPLKSPVEAENILLEHKKPPQNQQTDQNSQESGNELRKTNNPDRLKVPKVIETPLKSPVEAENILLEHKTPPQNQQTDQNSQESGNELRKTYTPDRLKVPKAFKYPERYRSPTDSMMSPVSKGLLARNRKGGALLPPSINQPKIQELLVSNAGGLF